MKRVPAFVCALALTISTTLHAWPLTYSAAEIRARIVDEVTGEPVSGVIVFARWYLLSELIGGGAHHLAHLHEFEAVTSSDGTFVIPAWGPTSRPPHAHFDIFVPQFRILKPGYLTRILANERPVPPEASLIDSSWNGKTITLPRATDNMQDYALSLLNAWKGDKLQCLRSCPRLLLTVYSEWERIRPSLSQDFLRVHGVPPFRMLQSDDREYLEIFRDTHKDAQ